MRMRLTFDVTMEEVLRRPKHFASVAELLAYTKTSRMSRTGDVYMVDKRGNVKVHIGAIKKGGALRPSQEWQDMQAVVKMFS